MSVFQLFVHEKVSKLDFEINFINETKEYNVKPDWSYPPQSTTKLKSKLFIAKLDSCKHNVNANFAFRVWGDYPNQISGWYANSREIGNTAVDKKGLAECPTPSTILHRPNYFLQTHNRKEERKKRLY